MDTTGTKQGFAFDRPSTDDGSVNVIEAISRAEVDIQIETAKRYPRNVRGFRDEALMLACMDEDTAAACMYCLPRGDKDIEGPSARFAEIVVSTWGNCMAGARVIDEGSEFVTAQGVFRDLERNTAITYEVKRRITDKNGRRYNSDMIGVTANAACSIALRNAALKGVPKAFWQSIYDEARRTAIGDVQSLKAKRHAITDYFAKMGVREPQLLHAVQRASMDEVDLEDVLTLRGIAQALKDGDTSIDQAFPPAPVDVGKTVPRTAPPAGASGSASAHASEPAQDEGGAVIDAKQVRDLAGSRTIEVVGGWKQLRTARKKHAEAVAEHGAGNVLPVVDDKGKYCVMVMAPAAETVSVEGGEGADPSSSTTDPPDGIPTESDTGSSDTKTAGSGTKPSGGGSVELSEEAERRFTAMLAIVETKGGDVDTLIEWLDSVPGNPWPQRLEHEGSAAILLSMCRRAFK